MESKDTSDRIEIGVPEKEIEYPSQEEYDEFYKTTAEYQFKQLGIAIKDIASMLEQFIEKVVDNIKEVIKAFAKMLKRTIPEKYLLDDELAIYRRTKSKRIKKKYLDKAKRRMKNGRE